MSKPINCDNFMSDRPSTRVHAPAGGRSSLDLFGGFAEAEARREAMPARGRRTAAPLRGSGTSANVFASGANQNCGNFITDRPTSRVLSAPGGRSSIVLG
ncbi:hypothetical protein FNF27_01489 [Cafeteria roenbergensis]|uniref:Uncharacterized protein n=1 Tax=Cafeteria roenbergensis TaxID=33653 RepID=A0A5A8C1Q9_CAFRO|nr:hypothetical protein FNF29_07917 [Cafeteria roenbergensis]KAA0160556.1 hypothetical protein FNF31_04265 [Cafeteria roenbergensis]KAA0163681.1 hypothetical protein FNF28_04158 [Cafeteria roenbergensis]KAA0177159.1 hypothetical protein FNF27_01489 [Cafeteria roenbergensis]|eukprot:KAA0146675.1 hypothetical protein FNF29_07917 [Cafeteria roenbergensis]